MVDKSKHRAPLSRGRGAGGEAEKGKNQVHIPLHAGAEPHQFRHAQKLRREMTEAEKNLWQYLRARRFQNLKFRRQHPLLDFVADFYCHQLHLVIEVDGKYHEEPDIRHYDTERTSELNRYGITVIRFTNKEIENEISNVLSKLKNRVKDLQAKRLLLPGKGKI